jgi:hypothetical protein
MSWSFPQDWITPSMFESVTGWNLRSWTTWIIITIVIIIIFWIIWGGGNHEFIGFKPLLPGIKPSQVMDKDTMIILGVNDPPQTKASSQDRYQEEGEFMDLSHLAPGAGSLTPLHETGPVSIRSISGRNIRENISYQDRNGDRDISIYLPSPDRPMTGQTPRFSDLDIGTAEERRTNSESKGERICREFLEKYYQTKFPRTRPHFLVNPMSGRNLELDGYNSEFNLAFEYNGYQHYMYPNNFHKNEEEFYQQLRRDEYKHRTCELAGVYLIIIPYTIPHEHIPKYIKQRLPHMVDLLPSGDR